MSDVIRWLRWDVVNATCKLLPDVHAILYFWSGSQCESCCIRQYCMCSIRSRKGRLKHVSVNSLIWWDYQAGCAEIIWHRFLGTLTQQKATTSLNCAASDPYLVNASRRNLRTRPRGLILVPRLSSLYKCWKMVVLEVTYRLGCVVKDGPCGNADPCHGILNLVCSGVWYRGCTSLRLLSRTSWRWNKSEDSKDSRFH